MKKELLYLVGGVILGWMLFQVADWTGSTPGASMEYDRTAVALDLETLERRIADLASEISKLSTALQFLPHSDNGRMSESAGIRDSGEGTRREEEGIPKREPIEPSPASVPDFRKAARTDFSWTDAIDASLARILVECGLTPYDPGVSSLLRDAGSKLRATTREYVETANQLRSTYRSAGRLQDYDPESKKLSAKRDEDRREILQAFEENLLLLSGQRPAKK